MKPEEHLDVLVERLVANEVSSAPCLTTEPDGKGASGIHANAYCEVPAGCLYHAQQH